MSKDYQRTERSLEDVGRCKVFDICTSTYKELNKTMSAGEYDALHWISL